MERRYDRLANFAAATSLVLGGTAIATILIPVRDEHSAVDVAGVVAFALGVSALLVTGKETPRFRGAPVGEEGPRGSRVASAPPVRRGQAGAASGRFGKRRAVCGPHEG
jgi:hypothetical protein